MEEIKISPREISESFTRVPNDIIRTLYSAHLSGRELRVVLFIIYQTYGYNHGSRELSNTYIANGTGIAYPHVSKIINSLAKYHIITKISARGRTPQKISMNIKISDWNITQKGKSTKKSTVTKNSNRTVTADSNQYNKDKYNKECVGENCVSPSHTYDIFDRLWEEWRYTRAGKDRVPKRIRAEIENIGYTRMTDVRQRYSFKAHQTKRMS